MFRLISTIALLFPAILFASEPGLWSLSPIQKHSLTGHEEETAIDQFIATKRAEQGLKPAVAAKTETLIRRLYFNLIGLPPSPEEFEDAQQISTEQLVDRLLASPRFGEKWGRHWLDLARYAESNGKDRDVVFPHAWRYRDYVISSFNQDKPYDQFVREQIAGDLLEDSSDEQKIATAFLALGPKAFQEPDIEKFKMDLVDEQIDVMSRSILGLTIACARCHDHKFDPIPTADYYALAGIFLSSETRYGPGPLYLNKHEKDTKLVPIGTRANELHPAVAAWRAEVVRLTEFVTGTRSAAYRIRREVTGTLRDRGLQKPEEAPDLLALHEKSEQMYADAEAKNQERIALIENPPPDQPGYTMAMQRASAPPENCRIRIGGMPKDHGPIVNRGGLSIPGMPTWSEISIEKSGRLELAEWLAAPENPLTARVIVNRVWHHLFGQGLVRTVDNFGVMGDEPSHPELLDHLSAGFIADGWSIKRLIRRIVLTETWQLSSESNAKNQEIDPENRFWWRANFRRLDIEQFRDAVLSVSGQLDLSPPDGSIMRHVYAGKDYGNGGNRVEFREEIASDRHRTIYLPIVRNEMPEFLQLFDFADPNVSIGARHSRTIPSQSLFLMNGTFLETQAKAAAQRILSVPAASRLELAFRLTSGAKPDSASKQIASAYLDLRGAETNEEDAWADLIHLLLASGQFRFLE
tara:strand:- start:49120 stop:51201 length:2082 start_codon:yes stop_codon:yes gene_type:complete